MQQGSYQRATLNRLAGRNSLSITVEFVSREEFNYPDSHPAGAAPPMSQRTYRPPMIGRNGAVGANHPMATQAGLDILRAGGNAVDAAVAISLTLGVVEPHMSGLGGDGFYHVLMGGVGQMFNGCGFAPAAATPEAFAGGMDVTGPRSVSVPGSLGGIAAMHAAHGKLPWARLCLPAIEQAREGFGTTLHYVNFARDNGPRFDAQAALTFPAAGIAALIRQEALARTLEEIAADGAETFYRGKLARRLAGNHTLITAADLERYQPEIQAPISAMYRGWEIRQTPPNSTGFSTLQMLRILERFDYAAMSPADRVHIMVEAKKRAFLDRERYGSDPRFETVPVEFPLSDDNTDRHVASIRMDRASEPALVTADTQGDTTYFCVIDAGGNAVSAIQSLNSAFGSGVIAGDTGVLLNNRMAYWHLAAGHPNRLAPFKRVRHTVNAPMILKDGALFAVLGTPGADNQVQVNLQIISALLDDGDHSQAAVERPRWTSSQPGQGANWPHNGDHTLTIENGFGPAILDDLERRGHKLKRVGPLEGPCAMQVITVAPNGLRIAGSDPRRDGWAGAY
jgi:gamma-glutamyltranspeptidase/glutathione hydrolase